MSTLLLSVATQSIAADEISAVEVETIVAAEVLSPDYALMQDFLARSTSNQRGRPAIAFKQLREAEPSFFQNYEDYLVGLDANSLPDDDRLAYWLNVQNFLVVKAVAFDTKKKSLKSLRGTGGSPGKLWTKDRVTIADQSYSIADIEAKIVAEFKDPNIVYGLYQGVKGGPCLSSTPYQGETVTARLAELGGQYVNSRGIVSPEKSVVTLTPVYEWQKTALFKNSDKEVLAHVKSHALTNLRGRLNRAHQVEYTKLNYAIDIHVPQKQGTRSKANRQNQGSQRRQQRPQQPSGGGSYGS
ncbi:MAG: DUF547 domain-containing protein [Maricaulaceae bacterium]